MKPIAVWVFPGTNCHHDVVQALGEMGCQSQLVWHKDVINTSEFDGMVVPGGFSFGDYLRPGGLAARSKPFGRGLSEAIQRGIPTLGICNGFQILCESGALPGALIRNRDGLFIDQLVDLKVKDSVWGGGGGSVSSLRMPIAHGDGRFFCQAEELKRIQGEGLDVLSYESENLNGSVGAIAGLRGDKGKVLGLMPHPERAVFSWMGSTDGKRFLEAVFANG